MHRHTLALAVVALALAAGVPPAAAQAPAQSDAPAPGQTSGPTLAQAGNSTATQTAAPDETERIDNNTVLVSAEYDEETGESVVTIESEILQDIVLTDASGLLQGGQVATRTITMTPDERTTVRLPATKADGYVVVGVSTRNTLYGKQIETSADLFQGDSTWDTVQAGAIGGGLGVLILTGILAWRRRRGGRNKQRRIA